MVDEGLPSLLIELGYLTYDYVNIGRVISCSNKSKKIAFQLNYYSREICGNVRECTCGREIDQFAEIFCSNIDQNALPCSFGMSISRSVIFQRWPIYLQHINCHPLAC